MYCPQCGKAIPEKSIFCMHCGNEIPAIPDLPEVAPSANPDVIREQDILNDLEETVPQSLEEGGFIDFDDDSTFLTTDAFEDHASLESESYVFEDFDSLDDFFLQTDPMGINSLAQVEYCSTCGRELPGSSTSDLCVTCVSNRCFVPERDQIAQPIKPFSLNLELDDEYPEAYHENQMQHNAVFSSTPGEKKTRFPFRYVILASIVLVLGMGIWFFISAFFQPVSDQKPAQEESSSTVSSNSREKDAVFFAQDMVRSKAANPSSVHFDKSSLSVSEENNTWIVKQTFERQLPSGKMANSSYTAIVDVEDNAEEAFLAVMLTVDDSVLYDNRKK